MSVWQRELFERNGPTLSSSLGMVKLNCWPAVEEGKVNVISAGMEETEEQGMPYVPGSAGLGWISEEMSEYIFWEWEYTL
jgi:hypothetical protein